MRTAIDTIRRAADVDGQKATRIREINGNAHFEKKVPCPFPKDFATDTVLKGADWTRYEGHLHTDHSIRPEFFHADASMPAAVASKKYVLDLTYLYNRTSRDYKKFVSGVPISWEEVEQIIGDESEWVVMKEQPRIRTRAGSARKQPGVTATSERKNLERARRLVKKSRGWRMSDDEITHVLMSQ